MKCLLPLSIIVVIGLSSTVANAQETSEPETRIVLQQTDNYNSQPTVLTTAQLRQQIAMEKAQHRRARMEYNAWRGHHPLRPTATDMPMMRSNYVYPYYRISYVPLYVR